MCAKIAMVSGRGLASVLRTSYPRPIVYVVVPALFIANTINVGADLGAIAAAVNVVVPVPIAPLIPPIAGIILALQIWGSYRLIANIFKWLTLALLSYVASSFFAKPDWGAVLHGTLLPSFSLEPRFLATLVAILGTTISPYLFFWQASQEVEEEVAMGRTRLSEREGATKKELGEAAWDVDLGMLFSNVVMYFIILATGATLFASGKTDIQSAADAAQALRPLAGDAAGILLAVGLIGAGFLAVPILSGSAAYAAAETFGWRFGLNEKPYQAKPFYLAIGVSTVVGILLNFVGINPIDALFWTAVINGFLAPPLLVLVMLIANNRDVMGTRANGRPLNVLGWVTAGAMFAAVIGLVLTWETL